MTHMDQVRAALENGCVGHEQIMKFTGLSKPRIKSALANAKARGRLERTEGRYKVVTPKQPPAIWSGAVLSEWRPYPFGVQA